MIWLASSGALVIGLIVGWLVRHYFKTPGFKSDTTLFFKKTGGKFKFYTLPTLIGTLLVSLAVLTVSRSKVAEFEALERDGFTVTERQYQLFQIDLTIAALTAWFTFINPSWQRAREKQKEAENGGEHGK